MSENIKDIKKSDTIDKIKSLVLSEERRLGLNYISIGRSYEHAINECNRCSHESGAYLYSTSLNRINHLIENNPVSALKSRSLQVFEIMVSEARKSKTLPELRDAVVVFERHYGVGGIRNQDDQDYARNATRIAAMNKSFRVKIGLSQEEKRDCVAFMHIADRLKDQINESYSLESFDYDECLKSIQNAKDSNELNLNRIIFTCYYDGEYWRNNSSGFDGDSLMQAKRQKHCLDIALATRAKQLLCESK